MPLRRVIAVRAKGGLEAISSTPEALCNSPCRYRLILEDMEWSGAAPWGLARYKGLMAVEPLMGVAGGTPVYCPASHCYKLEHVGAYTGFWDRGAETLASHMSLCGVTHAWSRPGPWIEALRAYAPRVSISEVEGGEAPGYCADILHNPFFHEGGATLIYEVYEQVGVPDAMIVPGYAPLLESIHVGLERLSQLGLIEEAPRIYAVDVGKGIPRWLLDSIEAVEVSVGRHSLEQGRRSLAELGLVNVDARTEAARLELLESGEIGRDEKVVVILTRA